MEKFNKFAENLMRVIVVPDETSDSVAPVQAQTEPQDMFSREVSNYMGDEEGGCGCGGGAEVQDEPHQEEIESEDVQVTHDTDGLKVQFNGMVVTLPNEVVEKIKEVIAGSAEMPESEMETEEPEEQEGEETESEESEDESEEEKKD